MVINNKIHFSILPIEVRKPSKNLEVYLNPVVYLHLLFTQRATHPSLALLRGAILITPF